MKGKVWFLTKIIIITVLFTTIFGNTSFAVTDQHFKGSKNLKNAVLLNVDDIIKIAEHHIDNYLSTDFQTKDKIIEPSKNLIALYDLDDNIFACLVPLIEVGEKEIGYITVGAIEDGYDSYQIFINNDIMGEIRQNLDIRATESKDAQAKIVFLPPMNYIIKVEGNNGTTYFSNANFTTQDTDITENIEKNRDQIESLYESIRDVENRKQIEKILKRANATIVGTDPPMSINVIPEDVRLENEELGSFVPVSKKDKTFYGGDQEWYADSTKISRGCGPTAAANITYYLANKDNSEYGELYPYSSIDLDDFLSHMNTLYDLIKPGLLGTTSLMDWTSKVEDYATSKGVTLNGVVTGDPTTLDNAATYIKNGLLVDSPVATLNLQPPYTGYGYAWHWMTITKYFRDEVDNRWIAVSSWGDRYSINYRTHYDAMANWLGGGLMYFD